MRGERQLLRLGGYLVHLACQPLPPDVREERYREWAAELPAILHDPQVRLAPWRAARMLGYAADTLRGTAMKRVKPRHRASRTTAAFNPFLVAGLAIVAWDIWTIVEQPGHGPNYLALAWGLLLVAYAARGLVRSAARVSTLILISSNLTAAAFFLWNAALAPGDWVNYFLAALLLVLLLASWLATWWARTRRA